jgi:cytochrome c oxidase subunit 2
MTPAALALAEVARWQSALDPAGPQAARIATTWWIFFAVCAGVYVVTMAVLAWVLTHPRGNQGLAPDPYGERVMGRGVAGGIVLTTVILFGLLVTTVAAGRRVSAFEGKDALTIEITGHQWWWEIGYRDVLPSQRVLTANEIHLPIGVPVHLELTSHDVIHSFWVPNLHGKVDLIPGRKTGLVLQADREGEFGGQCAEFCGMQHAHMRMRIVAEPMERFQAWLYRQRDPAVPPTDPQAEHGRQVFMGGPCATCHTIKGTSASATTGPDLTHVASRRSLGADSIPNTRGHLAGWILDAQSVKPGSRMPSMAFPAEDVHALIAYLETLK